MRLCHPIRTVILLGIISTSLLFLTGCEKKFSAFLEKAKIDFSERNYVNTVDVLNEGLLHWKESDGTESKAEALQLMGQSYHRLRTTDKAIESYAEAIRLSTNTFLSAYSLGMILLAKSQFEPAANAFQKALQMKEDDSLSLLGLANCHFARRRYKDAQIVYQKVIDTSPGVREALESLTLIKGKLREKPAGTKNGHQKSSYKAPAKKQESGFSFKKTSKKK